MISVEYAANETTGKYAGLTIAEIRHEVRDVLNIPEDASAMVDNEVVPDDYYVREGQSVRYLPKAGRKG